MRVYIFLTTGQQHSMLFIPKKDILKTRKLMNVKQAISWKEWFLQEAQCLKEKT